MTIGRARTHAPAMLATALLVVAGCAHRGPPPAPPESPPARAAQPAAPRREPEGPAAQVGLASFYSHRFHGRRTASGTRYDMHALTCAHRTLPFGTRVRITDVETGRTVEVTVTDRGPFARGRVVDLSLAAARRLGIVKRGVARVRVEPVDDG